MSKTKFLYQHYYEKVRIMLKERKLKKIVIKIIQKLRPIQ